MQHMTFCALAVSASMLVGGAAEAQRVSGRDLLEFPIAVVAEPPLLATLSGAGLWNPAILLLGEGQFARAAVAALEGPPEQGFEMQLVSVALRAGAGRSVGISVVRASVADIPRTEGDPQSLGRDIRYSTTLLSAAYAQKVNRFLDAGAALRFRSGVLDDVTGSNLSADVGVKIGGFGLSDMRIAAATFLLAPGSQRWGEVRLGISTDVRVAGGSDVSQLRAGYSYSHTADLADDHMLTMSARLSSLEVNGGLLHSEIHGSATNRWRLGVAIRAGYFTVGLAREENPGGVAPTYQVSIAKIMAR